MESRTALSLLLDAESLFFNERLIRHQLLTIANANDIMTSTYLFDQYHSNVLSFEGAAVLMLNAWKYRVEDVLSKDEARINVFFENVCEMRRVLNHPNLISDLVYYSILIKEPEDAYAKLLQLIIDKQYETALHELELVSMINTSRTSTPVSVYTPTLVGVLHRDMCRSLQKEGYVPLSQARYLLTFFKEYSWLFEGGVLPWIPMLSDNMSSSEYDEYVSLCTTYQQKLFKQIDIRHQELCAKC
jgi:hypothetical protein